MADVTVAIPVRNGGALFRDVLTSLAAQTIDHELLVCDSGSTDESVHIARSHHARIIEIAPSQFNHGSTRNLLMHAASGSYVAFLTQDAEPADERWLERLLSGFRLAHDVGLVYGPYLARPSASVAVQIELKLWFTSLAPDDYPRIDRFSSDEREISTAELAGARGFFTDANACISRAAWSEVPFRQASYAEDRALAIDMLRAGYAKVYMPSAAVVHSHDYSAFEQVRRCFDEWRALHEVYGLREPSNPRHLLLQLRGQVGRARAVMATEDLPPRTRSKRLMAVAIYHVLRLMGAVLGSRADRLPPGLQRLLSLERRAGFKPLDLDTCRPMTNDRGLRD